MINDLKELEKFLKLCRKQGVTDISFAGLSVKLGALPSKANMDDSDEIPTDEPSPDELIYYAVNGGPQ